jgi:DNA ligase-1
VRLSELVRTSQAVAAASGRLHKIGLLAELLARTPPEEREVALAFLSGTTRQGRIGIGGSALHAAREVPAAAEASLEIDDVDRRFALIGGIGGAGSAGARDAALRELLRLATEDEQDFLARLLFGELRQGALEGVLLEAVAKASGVSAARLRRAVMLGGALPPVGAAALNQGETALTALVLRPLQPIQPMLAESAASVDDALNDLGEASLEYKLDGARIQVHKSGDAVRVFSRTLKDVTGAVPEVVEAVRALPAETLIVDGEAIALRPDGTPQPFQVTMRRFGRKLDVESLRATLPVSPYLFDCLYVDGQPLIDDPLSRRVAALDEIAPATLLVPRLVPADSSDAAAFVERALSAGHEGVMAKALAGAYKAGRRGGAWLKVKQARTLDLVVLAVEWGSGRRRGTLSNLHLGARDAERGGFVMLGKTFKGLTDQLLAWQTRALLEREIGRDGHIVHVRPELVVEIAFNEIQESPVYPGRLALRFARVKRYRSDKTADSADTFQSVQAIYRQATGLEPPAR